MNRSPISAVLVLVLVLAVACFCAVMAWPDADPPQAAETISVYIHH